MEIFLSMDKVRLHVVCANAACRFCVTYFFACHWSVGNIFFLLSQKQLFGFYFARNESTTLLVLLTFCNGLYTLLFLLIC